MSTKEHVFPKDWREISEDEIVEHIQYLLEHYKEYQIKRYNKKHVMIGDVYFVKCSVPVSDCNKFCYMINMQALCHMNHKAYQLLEQLMDICKAEVEKQEKIEIPKWGNKLTRKKEINDIIIYSALTIMLIVGIPSMVYFKKCQKKEDIKKAKIENAVKQYEQSLPEYSQYVTTKEKINQYRDSLYCMESR